MNMRAISDVFSDFQKNLPAPSVSVEDILEALHERGFGFLLLIFSAPMALPFPDPPIVNIILATPMVILTAQQALGRHTIWMPRRLKLLSVSREKVDTVLGALLPWMRRLEKISRPRLDFMTQGFCSRLAGLFGLVMALTACIPVPLTHTVPSLGIAIMAVGIIMRDGLAVLTGAAVGMLWIAMLVFAVLIFGPHGIDMIKDAIP
jgi:hypothetical protein